MSNSRLPLLLGLVGGFFLVKNFITEEIENYENNLGVTFKGFRPKWTIIKPLTITLEIDVDIRNDNVLGGQVLGSSMYLTWGKDGPKIVDIGVQPFNLQGNGAINKSTWLVDVQLLSFALEVQEQIKAGTWKQLPYVHGDLKTSYGKVSMEGDALPKLD